MCWLNFALSVVKKHKLFTAEVSNAWRKCIVKYLISMLTLNTFIKPFKDLIIEAVYQVFKCCYKVIKSYKSRLNK